MEPLRSLSRQDSEKSEARREHQRANAAVQNVTDTMIAVTESFRHHYHQQYAGYSPTAPAPTYTHSRSSSNTSESTERLLDLDPMRHVSVSDLSSSANSPYQSVSAPSIIGLGRSPTTESDYLLDPDLDSDMTERNVRIPQDLIRLATPNLPPRLDTPHTPPSRFSIPVNLAEPRPYVSPTQLAPPASDFGVNHGGLVQAARRFEAFRSTTQHHQYIVLRPDVGTETQPLGTVTRIRAGSDPESPTTKGVRRKPLTQGARPIEFNHSTNEALFVAVICMAQVLAYAGLAQTLVPARRIGDSFSESERATGHLTWYSAAYALGFGATTLLGNRLGNVCGQRYTFVAGYLWFSLWSLLAGLSTYVQQNGDAGTVYFCVCRSMQGIGPALLVPNGQGMLQRAYPPGPRKTLAKGLFDVAAPLGFVLGSVMSGLFASFASWPWGFYSLAAVCLALGASSILIIPVKKVLVHDFEGNLWKRLDALGLLFGTATLVLFSVGWNQAPIVSFNSAQPYVLIFAGVILIPLCVVFEKQASHPLLPFKQMHLAAGATLGLVAASWAAFGIWVWYFIQSFEVLRSWDALHVAAGLVPIIVAGVVVGFAGSPFVNHDLTAQLAMIIASAAMLISSTLMATAPVQQQYWLNAFISTIFMGIGLVLIIPASETVLSRSVPQGHPGLSSSLVTTVALFAFSVSLGMSGAVEMGKSKESSPLGGYRDAQYFGLGLSGLSLVLAIGLLCAAYRRR
ncbi:hypothetical protein FZEAL_3837 [Fusarium zealandicum]|uniref:Major facilitator superfamily (MFS) profile domain-containing protein n=1 Tax=Fusarium zealandicum TaxID=1053134 RepID=A0A8H4XMI0_9HYPO|nr:hypothetical protein FZEAL_3837 [Fusarium zealandicum]